MQQEVKRLSPSSSSPRIGGAERKKRKIRSSEGELGASAMANTLSLEQPGTEEMSLEERSAETAKSISRIATAADEALHREAYDEAIELYGRALGVDSENVNLLLGRADAFFGSGQLEAALCDAAAAVRLRPDQAGAHERRGRILHRLRRLDEAREAFLQCLALTPSHPSVARLLDDIEVERKISAAQERRVKGLSDDFECVLCMKLFYDPITTPCGHSFCRSCLRRALDHGSSCPLCRAILHISSDYPVTVALKNIIERNFPEEYAARKAEIEAERAQSEESMPLFVLNAVVFPNMRFPMHIFEPRYRLMLRRCLDGSRRFGLVSCRRGADGRWVPADTGCILQITEHQPLPDGRSYIDCVGRRRFKVLEKWDQDGYLCGKIQYFDDEPLTAETRPQFVSVAIQTRELLSTLLSTATGALRTGLQQLMARAGDIPNDDVEFSFWMAANMPLPALIKQELLGMTDSAQRLRRLLDLLSSPEDHGCGVQ